jgi:excisionase family DNA binding protein
MASDLSGDAAEISVTTDVNDNPSVAEPIRLVLTIGQAARRLGIGRTLMYSLVMSGEVESVTIGRLRRIPVECLTEYVTKLRDTQQADQAA